MPYTRVITHPFRKPFQNVWQTYQRGRRKARAYKKRATRTYRGAKANYRQARRYAYQAYRFYNAVFPR